MPLLWLIIVLEYQQNTFAQKKEVSWLSFEQLEDSLAVTQKKSVYQLLYRLVHLLQKKWTKLLLKIY